MIEQSAPLIDQSNRIDPTVWTALGDRLTGLLSAGLEQSEAIRLVARELAGTARGFCAVYQADRMGGGRLLAFEQTSGMRARPQPPARVDSKRLAPGGDPILRNSVVHSADEWVPEPRDDGRIARTGEAAIPVGLNGEPGRVRRRRLGVGDRALGWLFLAGAVSPADLDRLAELAGPLLALYLASASGGPAAGGNRQSEEHHLLAEAIQLFNEAQRPEPVLDFILQRVAEMLEADRGVLRLVNEERDRLDLGAIYARDPRSLAELKASVQGEIQFGESVAGRVAMSGEPIIVTDHLHEGRANSLGTHSLLSLPLRTSQEVIGTLTVGFTQAQQFLPERLGAARNLANLATLVLENARQHARTQRQAREAIALFEVARALTSTMSVQEILRQITRQAAELLDVQYCLYCRYDQATGHLIGEVGHGVSEAEIASIEMPISPLTAEAIATRRAVFAPDAPSDPRVYLTNVRRFGIKSVLCTPLIIKGRFLGVIYLYDKQRRRVFAPEELDLMTNFTAYAAVAIENSNLHQGLQRTLDQLLVLYQAGRDISSSLELDSVAEAVTRSLAHLFRADQYVISELTGDGSDIQVLAARGTHPRYLALREQPAVLDRVRRVLESAPQSATVVGAWPVPELATGEGAGGAGGAAGQPAGDAGAAVGRIAGGETPGEAGSVAEVAPGAPGAPAGYLQIVPLRARGRVVAAIEIFSATANLPSADNHDLLLAIGATAGAAIEHAKLYAVVRDQQSQLESLIEALITAQEEERRRIAYDVHDGLAQTIVSADQHLQTYQELVRQGAPQAEATLERGLRALGRAIAESRRVISHLRPPGLDDFGLIPALEEYLGELRAETGWRIALIDRLGRQQLSPAVETTVYRIVQEAVANARKYAQPERIRVFLTAQDGQLIVEVRDWGKGFDPAQIDRPGRSGHRIGLISMQERARLIGGSCQVESAPQHGTRVRVTIPLTGPESRVTSRESRVVGHESWAADRGPRAAITGVSLPAAPPQDDRSPSPGSPDFLPGAETRRSAEGG